MASSCVESKYLIRPVRIRHTTIYATMALQPMTERLEQLDDLQKRKNLYLHFGVSIRMDVHSNMVRTLRRSRTGIAQITEGPPIVPKQAPSSAQLAGHSICIRASHCTAKSGSSGRQVRRAEGTKESPSRAEQPCRDRQSDTRESFSAFTSIGR